MKILRYTAFSLLVILAITSGSLLAQGPFPAQIQQAFQQLGLWPFGIYADGEVPAWSAAQQKFVPGTGGGDISQLVYDVTSVGIACDGNDHSAELLALLATAQAAGGGSIYFPPCGQPYRFDSQILIPNIAQAPGDWGYPRPRQSNLRITGAAGGKLWYNPSFVPGVTAVPGLAAALIDLRYQSTVGRAKIETYGLGTLRIDNLAFTDYSGVNRTPFVHSSNTTLIIRDSTFLGTGALFGTADAAYTGNAGYPIGTTTIALQATGTGTIIVGDLLRFTNVDGVYQVTVGDSDVSNGGNITFTPALTEAIPAANTAIAEVTQDAIVLGGTNNVFDGNPEQTFQGYGTEIVGNHFYGINRGVYGLNSANGVMFSRNTFQGNVLNGTAIEFDSSNGAGFFNYGLNITDNLIEMNTYRYGIKLTYDTRESSFVGNQFHDPDNSVTRSMFYFGTLSIKNTIVCSTNSDLFNVPLATGAYAQYNTFLCPSLVANVEPSKGTQGNQFSYGAIVRSTYDDTKQFAGQLIVESMNDLGEHLDLGYDHLNARAEIDAAVNAAGRTLRLNKVTGGDVMASSLGFNTGPAWKDDAPTISTACTSPTVTWHNGTAVFQVDVGTSCTGRSVIVLTLPAVTNRYRCDGDNISSPSTRVLRATSSSTTSVTLTNFDWAGVAQDWVDGTDVVITCTGG